MAKDKKCDKFYILKDGTESRHASSQTHDANDVVRLEFCFANGNTHAIKLSDYPEEINLAATWHGHAQSKGDSFVNAKNANEAEEMFLTRNELHRGGEWITQRAKGEVSPNLLIEAIVAGLEADGQTVDEERRAEIAAKLSPRNAEGKVDREAAAQARKRALANEIFAAQYERLKAEEAAKRRQMAEDKMRAALAAGTVSVDF